MKNYFSAALFLEKKTLIPEKETEKVWVSVRDRSSIKTQ